MSDPTPVQARVVDEDGNVLSDGIALVDADGHVVDTVFTDTVQGITDEAGAKLIADLRLTPALIPTVATPPPGLVQGRCYADGCGRVIPNNELLCARHQAMIPAEMQADSQAAYAHYIGRFAADEAKYGFTGVEDYSRSDNAWLAVRASHIAKRNHIAAVEAAR